MVLFIVDEYTAFVTLYNKSMFEMSQQPVPRKLRAPMRLGLRSSHTFHEGAQALDA